MARYEAELARKASRLMEALSLSEDGPCGRREPRGRKAEAAAGRAPQPGCCEDGLCTRSEVALPCYDKSRRYSAEGAHGQPKVAGSYPKYGAASPRAASEPGRFPSLVAGPGPEKFPSWGPGEGGALSPRSSYASTASDTSKPSSPRASLTSSNRTSGISMGYDQRHASPRSSTASPRSSYSDSRAAGAELDGAGGLSRLSLCGSCPPAVLSPRSSISSHSSRSSRGSMSAYPELQAPSPRSSLLLGPGLQEEEAGDVYPRVRAQSPEPASAPYGYSPAKSSAPAAKFKLPYQVTPSRESGPSQAERRLEALTLELEKELEMHMKKEYFGICIKCGKGVYGASQACQAMGNLYHTNCFTCCSCGRRLRGKAFYNVNGKVYCEEDFLVSKISGLSFVCLFFKLTVSFILQALGKSYHPGCFRCVVCNECLDGVPFTVDVENNIYCVKDYHTVFAPKCASCNQPILPAQGSEETIRVVSRDRDYHVECYHCEDCGLQLNGEEGHRCYPLEGHLLCHGCHIRRLNVKVPPHPPPSYPMHVTEL
uniref:WT1 interacting protein n=1 Tax=Pelusios castaneus TaxID=367368 RepID=A0A8C8VEG5_9SAUR